MSKTPDPADTGTTPLTELIERLQGATTGRVLQAGQLPELAAAGFEPPEDTDRYTDTAGLAGLPLPGQRYSLALIGTGFETLDLRTGERLLAELRDLRARTVLVRIPDGSHWRDTDLTALAYTRAARLPDAGVQYFGFDLARYKPAPDWLNADHWANPRQFDRYRW